MSDHFIIHLESVPNFLSPDNKPAFFTQNLQDPIHLRERENYRWEVALEAISIPNAIYNINYNESTFYYIVKIKNFNREDIPDSNVIPTARYTYFDNEIKIVQSITLPMGFYDPISYADTINRKLTEAARAIVKTFEKYVKRDNLKITFKYDNILKKFLIEMNAPLIFDKIDENTGEQLFKASSSSITEELEIPDKNLRDLYGCEISRDHQFINKSGHLTFMCNMYRKFQKIFVMTDIVHYSIINNFYVPILRIIDMSKHLTNNYATLDTMLNPRSRKRFRMSENMINPTFERLQYYPLKSVHFNKIMIKLADEHGNDLQFNKNTRDVTTVTLHFRENKIS